VELYAEAGGGAEGTALACVGSLARRELGPRSDIDLVLLHDGKGFAQTNGLAERLWYPLWDARLRLDHAVRTPAECAEVAGAELSAGVGLLDLRLLAGDPALVSKARSGLLGTWRGSARRRLPELLSSVEDRLRTSGDAAYLLEPDLKEARGGFRDMSLLRALSATWLTDRPHDEVRQPYERLLDVRDALHVTSGRALDRLVASEAGDVAALLGFDDSDALHRMVSLAARRIKHAVDLTLRAARQAVPERRVLSFVRRERKPVYSAAPYGLIVASGEVGLDRDTSPASPLLGLRAGALAAQRGLVLSPVTAANLGAHAPAIEVPWPQEAREALSEMLATGPNLIPVWEALDLAGCIIRWIPEWQLISAQPQHNPIHRHTVDRHSVQTVVEAHAHLTQVERPDLLLLACIFHDVGKVPGAGPNHAQIGAPIARRAVEAMGLSQADAALVERLVAHHLTLADLATRRDHADPATQDALVDAVDGRAEVLNLLTRLTESDARAAGPAAWSPWRAQLIAALADRVQGVLVGQQHAASHLEQADRGLAQAVRHDGKPRVRPESTPGGAQLVVAALDRLGLFSEVAGLLASSGLSVRSAVLTTVDAVSVSTWRLDKQLPSDLPDPALLAQQLEQLERGDDAVLASMRRKEVRALTATTLPQPYVELMPAASDSALVVEVRTQDRGGLLYALGLAITGQRLSIRSAHISTLAGQAIDTFYVTETDGSRPEPTRREHLVQALLEAAGSSAAAAVEHDGAPTAKPSPAGASRPDG